MLHVPLVAEILANSSMNQKWGRKFHHLSLATTTANFICVKGAKGGGKGKTFP
jgi:ABC-type transport system involved in cytochrome c biogenesis ATPase subunit